MKIPNNSITTLNGESKSELRNIQLEKLLNPNIIEFEHSGPYKTNQQKIGEIKKIPNPKKFNSLKELDHYFYWKLNELMKTPKEMPMPIIPRLFDHNVVDCDGDKTFSNDSDIEPFNNRQVLTKLCHCLNYLIDTNSLCDKENNKLNLIVGDDCLKFFKKEETKKIINLKHSTKIPKGRIIIYGQQCLIEGNITPGLIINRKKLTITETENWDNNYIWIDIEYQNEPIYY